ncbi:uncharacterized protein LOC135659889 isoform X1 [Musa acuminata AAA Group]|uniref:(wild Malaysian banana) hypothetical protein n=1 Tax=Musa acuminata subsp. malaccensis TaxID=214687 RepID=A0A804HT09_MUSAM|nr:PREDICTED: transcriptional regulator ATRX-like isoform X1 [Musa acuminata subsp. malaccensis]CAG1859261.1 unnamed protein product [Musa acuminata subsp. malaccensis]
MEGLGGLGFSGTNAVMKKPRSATLRRPRPEAQLVSESCDISPLSSTPSLNNSRKFSPDDDGGSESSVRRKEFYLNNPPPKSSSINIASSKKTKKVDKVFGEVDGGYHGVSSSRGGHRSDMKRCSEGVLAPAKWKNTDRVKEDNEKHSISPDANVRKSDGSYNVDQSEGISNVIAENKPRKVKLKVGGVTRTILETGDDGSSAKPPRSLDSSRHRLKLIARLQDYSDGHSLPERGNGSQGDQGKQLSGSSFIHGMEEASTATVAEASLVGKQTDKLHMLPSSAPTRKSKRVPKRRMFDDDEEDEEIRYLEKLKSSKVSADDSAGNDGSSENIIQKKKLLKIPRNRNTAFEVDEDYTSSRSSKDNRRKLRPGRESDDTDYVEEEEPGSDGETEIKRRKQKETSGSPADVRTEPLTTRQRALQSGKAGNGESFVEFPNGLPPAPSRKQKEKLSEVEIQAKKAEAAQRRKMQVEKQARESEAEAIRKILGQDSDKKKEEKKQKELEEKARFAKSQALGPSTIRCVIGPGGTVVTFADDVGLPSIFNSRPCSYPPPREKCAAPSCSNAYKYRDSKTKLPLCSLQCYREVKGSAESTITC